MIRHYAEASLWGLVSLVLVIGSVRLGLGTASAPGPGFMPFLVALCLAALSFLLLARSRTRDWGHLDRCEPGDVLRFCQPGGGGYGDPLEREPEMVEDDVRNGYVSVARARDDYGVVLDPTTLRVDLAATVQLRDDLRASRGGR